MNWDGAIDRMSKIVDVAIKFETHALLMVGLGALMCVKGSKEEGQLIIGAGLAVFKGNR